MSITSGSNTVSVIVCGILFRAILYNTWYDAKRALDVTVAVLTKRFCWIRISSSFLRRYSLGLFLISECFIWRCRFSLFGFTGTQNTPRSLFAVNYEARETERQIRFIVLMRVQFRYTTPTITCSSFSSGSLFLPFKNLCIILWFRKHWLALDTEL
jgi:hypothetical protein